eukprot:scaffold18483_cov51-Phaeocystis_antarctica.AAC.4
MSSAATLLLATARTPPWEIPPLTPPPLPPPPPPLPPLAPPLAPAPVWASTLARRSPLCNWTLAASSRQAVRVLPVPGGPCTRQRRRLSAAFTTAAWPSLSTSPVGAESAAAVAAALASTPALTPLPERNEGVCAAAAASATAAALSAAPAAAPLDGLDGGDGGSHEVTMRSRSSAHISSCEIAGSAVACSAAQHRS